MSISIGGGAAAMLEVATAGELIPEIAPAVNALSLAGDRSRLALQRLKQSLVLAWLLHRKGFVPLGRCSLCQRWPMLRGEGGKR